MSVHDEEQDEAMRFGPDPTCCPNCVGKGTLCSVHRELEQWANLACPKCDSAFVVRMSDLGRLSSPLCPSCEDAAANMRDMALMVDEETEGE